MPSLLSSEASVLERVVAMSFSGLLLSQKELPPTHYRSCSFLFHVFRKLVELDLPSVKVMMFELRKVQVPSFHCCAPNTQRDQKWFCRDSLALRVWQPSCIAGVFQMVVIMLASFRKA